MKNKFLKLIQKFLFTVAIFSAITPSQMSMYQPEVPEKLKSLK